MSSYQSGSTKGHSGVVVNPLKNQVDMAKEGDNGTETTDSTQDINPFEMPLMMEKIISFLDLDSIKKARLVNKLWGAEGAKALIKRCYVKSPWKILLQKPSRKSKKEFRAFLAHTSRADLMVPNITIANASDLDLWKSFGVLGKQVTSLKLNFAGEEAIWLRKLFDLLPNLKYLNIKNLKNKRENITKILKFVLSSVEMNRIRNPLIISPMVFYPDMFHELEVVKKLSDCKKIMTDELTVSSWLVLTWIPNFEAQLANIINKLLSTNQNTLKKFSVENCGLLLSLLEFPCMTRLNQLKLSFWRETPGHLNQCQFSPSFIFSEKVPNLEHVSLHWEMMDLATMNQNFLVNLFASTGEAHSVKRLSYSGFSSEFAIDPLFQAFPNVQDLQVLGTEYSQNLFDSLWTHGKKLRKLYLHIKADRLKKDSNLDSKFTGFTPDTVSSIQKSQKSGHHTTLEKWEKKRVNPSILNLQELEHLGIHLKGPGIEELPEDFLTFAGEYAFKRMPKKLKISIHAKHEQLEGIEKALAQVSKLPNVSLFLKKKIPFSARNVSLICSEL